jgi:hypothetical protein
VQLGHFSLGPCLQTPFTGIYAYSLVTPAQLMHLAFGPWLQWCFLTSSSVKGLLLNFFKSGLAKRFFPGELFRLVCFLVVSIISMSLADFYSSIFFG